MLLYTHNTQTTHTHKRVSLSRARREGGRARVPRSAHAKQGEMFASSFWAPHAFKGLLFRAYSYYNRTGGNERRRRATHQRPHCCTLFGRTAHTVSRANELNVASDHPCSSSMSLLDMGHVSHDLFCIDVRHAWPHTTVPVTDSGASRHASHGRVSHVTSDISVGSDVTSTKPSHHSHTGLTHLTTLHCDKARRPGRGFHTRRFTRPAP